MCFFIFLKFFKNIKPTRDLIPLISRTAKQAVGLSRGILYEMLRFFLNMRETMYAIFLKDKQKHRMPLRKVLRIRKNFKKIFKTVKPNDFSSPPYKRKGQTPNKNKNKNTKEINHHG